MPNYSLLVVSLIYAIIAIASVSSGLAIPKVLEKRIYGGFIVPDSIVPYIVSLTSADGVGVGKCGGTLVTPKHVLTAAHCVISREEMVFPPQNITIGYNSTDKDDQDTVQATKVTLYPNAYVNGTLDMDLDIAIVEFSGFKTSVSASRVPIYDKQIEEGQAILSLGWGIAEATVADRSELRGSLTILSSVDDCNNGTDSGLVDNGPVICALGKSNVGKCIMSGDSGTGAAINDNGQLKLAAINSQVSVAAGGLGCEDGTLNAFYIRPGYFVDFVAKKTGYSKDYLTGNE